MRCVGNRLSIMETNSLKLRFVLERETKNHLRFSEQVLDRWGVPAIANIYLSKHAIKALGYREGDALEITIAAVR